MNLGPVARTVRTLVEKGLLTRVANPANRRADLLELTQEGHAVLEGDPRRSLVARLSVLAPETLAGFSATLDLVLKGLFQDWKGMAEAEQPDVSRGADGGAGGPGASDAARGW